MYSVLFCRSGIFWGTAHKNYDHTCCWPAGVTIALCLIVTPWRFATVKKAHTEEQTWCCRERLAMMTWQKTQTFNEKMLVVIINIILMQRLTPSSYIKAHNHKQIHWVYICVCVKITGYAFQWFINLSIICSKHLCLDYIFWGTVGVKKSEKANMFEVQILTSCFMQNSLTFACFTFQRLCCKTLCIGN